MTDGRENHPSNHRPQPSEFEVRLARKRLDANKAGWDDVKTLQRAGKL